MTMDAGVTWHESGLLRTPQSDERLALSSTNSNMLYVFGEHLNFPDGRMVKGDVWRTTDGGTTWDVRAASAPRGSPVVDASDPSTGYVIGSGRALRSTDGASSFEQIGVYDVDSLNERAAGVQHRGGVAAMSVDGSRMWFISSDGGLFRSLDRGVNWERLADVPFATFARSFSASPHDPSVLFAVTYGSELWAYREPALTP
jgi:photosystem II stability/assembly factor-like uncharacterized protein